MLESPDDRADSDGVTLLSTFPLSAEYGWLIFFTRGNHAAKEIVDRR